MVCLTSLCGQYLGKNAVRHLQLYDALLLLFI